MQKQIANNGKTTFPTIEFSLNGADVFRERINPRSEKTNNDYKKNNN